MPTFKEFVPLVPVNICFEIEEGTRILFNGCYKKFIQPLRNKLLGRNEPVVASREIYQESAEFETQ